MCHKMAKANMFYLHQCLYYTYYLKSLLKVFVLISSCFLRVIFFTSPIPPTMESTPEKRSKEPYTSSFQLLQ